MGESASVLLTAGLTDDARRSLADLGFGRRTLRDRKPFVAADFLVRPLREVGRRLAWRIAALVSAAIFAAAHLDPILSPVVVLDGVACPTIGPGRGTCGRRSFTAARTCS